MRRSILSPLVLALALTAGGVFAISPAQARGGVVVYAPMAPPPLRAERMPPPRMGYVWIGGSWAWSHGRYRWSPGYWSRAHHGRHYVQPRWEHGRRGWHRRDGYWR